jgi:hypothetical protein
MEEALENGRETSHSAHANGMELILVVNKLAFYDYVGSFRLVFNSE